MNVRNVLKGQRCNIQGNVFKLFYLVIILVFSYQTYVVVMDYITQPVATSITFVREQTQEPLPYVQICSQYWVNKTKLLNWNVSSELFEYMKAGFLAFNNYKGLRKLDDLRRLAREFRQYKGAYRKRFGRSFDYRRFFRSVALRDTSIIDRCYWQETKYSCRKLFEPIFTASGLCHLLRPEMAPQQQTPGPEGGLKLIVERKLHLEPDVFYNTGLDDGIHLSIRGQWTPQLTDPVFIAMGKRAYLQLRRTRFERVKKCVHSQNLSLFENERYSQAGCLHECYVRYSLRRCKCTTFTYNVPLKRRQFCSPARYRSCMRPLRYDFYQSVYSKCLKHCLRDCDSTEIATTISYANTDSWRVQVYNTRKNRSWDWKPSETIAVYIYYSQIGHTLIREHWTITRATLISNIGGQLGLWMGFSALSVTTLFRLYAEKRLRRRRRSQKQSNISSSRSSFSSHYTRGCNNNNTDC